MRRVMDYKPRVGTYANALEELYWEGYMYADLSADRFVRWTLAEEEVENWVDCAVLSGDTSHLSKADLELVLSSGGQVGGRRGNGVYQARELACIGIAPQSGKLACTTNCHCHLEPAQRPKGKGGETVPRFVSLRAKVFKAWFGDWESAPEEASKVANAPKKADPGAVYGPGFYFTEDAEVARSYATGNGDGRPGPRPRRSTPTSVTRWTWTAD